MQEDWGSDYSMLLQQVEAGISPSQSQTKARASTSASASSSSITEERVSTTISSASKRKRNVADEEEDEDDVFPTRLSGRGSGRLSMGDSRRLHAEVDQLKLACEESAAKLRLEQDSRGREQARHNRQLEFLESECIALKKSLTEKTDKFYEDKRTWQVQIRELEEANRIAKAAAPVAAPAAATATTASDAEARNARWEARMSALEGTIRTKSEEIARVKSQNADLEADNGNLTQLVKNLQEEALRLEDTGGSEDEAGKKMKTQLESRIREKNRAIERLERRLEQMAAVQQENTSLSSKLAASAERGEAVSELQAQLQKLVSEREEWMMLFRHSLKQAKSSAHASIDMVIDTRAADAHIPMQVLRLLKKTQEMAAVSSSEAAAAEAELGACRRRLTQSESAGRKMGDELGEAKLLQDKHESECRLLRQQSQLFEKEVVSLRQLLKSFDAEFCIGKPKEAASLFEVKDGLIEGLRAELDAVRREASTSIVQVQELRLRLSAADAKPAAAQGQGQGQAASAPAPTAEASNQAANISALREEVGKLRFRLREFQRASGTDYIESETRVYFFFLILYMLVLFILIDLSIILYVGFASEGESDQCV
jgi:chromosome segregation ATPase